MESRDHTDKHITSNGLGLVFKFRYPTPSTLNTRPQPCVKFLRIWSQRTRLCNAAYAKLQTCLQTPKPNLHLNRNLKEVPKVKTKPTSKANYELNRNLSHTLSQVPKVKAKPTSRPI